MYSFCGCCCFLIILVAFFSFFFFFSLILYFWKSNLYSRFLIFAFLVFVVNFVHLKTQSSAPNFTWEQDYWLDHSLLLWTLLFLHQVASVSSLPLLFSTQLCESLCVPDSGEHLRNWLLAGSVSLICISLFYPPGHLCLLPPSPLLCITSWTSLSGPDCGAHIRKWLLASFLSPLLIPPHLIPVTSNYPLPLLFSM